MKKTFALVAYWLAALPGPLAWAQQPAAPVPKAQRIAVVRMDAVYHGYEKVKDFKSRLDNAVQPFATKKAELDKVLSDQRKTLTTQTLSPEAREKAIRVLIECNRNLEDLEVEFRRNVLNKLAKEFETIGNEVRRAINRYALSQGIDQVIAVEDEETKSFSSAPVRFTVVIQPNPRIAYAAPGVDVTQAIIDFLNAEYGRTMKKPAR